MVSSGQLLAYVRRCSRAFERVDDYPLADRALRPLFTAHRPNTDHASVLAKTVALNGLYRAGVLDIYRMAAHIHRNGRQLDHLLAAGDPRAVALVRWGHRIKKRRGSEFGFYSFATKYCHWHQPDQYPMYDSYVVVALKTVLRSLDQRDLLRGADLRDFSTFRRMVAAAKQGVGWKRHGYKGFDQALWIMGKVIEHEIGASVLAAVRPIPHGLRRR